MTRVVVNDLIKNCLGIFFLPLNAVVALVFRKWVFRMTLLVDVMVEKREVVIITATDFLPQWRKTCCLLFYYFTFLVVPYPEAIEECFITCGAVIFNCVLGGRVL